MAADDVAGYGRSAMAHEHVEIVRLVYEAFNRRDWEAVFRDQSPDVELRLPPGLNADTYRGREECQGYFEEILMPFASLTTEPEELFESGDQVVVVVKTRARPTGATADIEIRNGHLWAVHDGKLASLEIFPEPEKALEAAGLRP